ncbi:MAG: hypothetical protein M1825_000366 [Sarcosagium campestre]|nr:MAG: hypothetical protein M1825_000366 [Sarcosagium campestre]
MASRSPNFPSHRTPPAAANQGRLRPLSGNVNGAGYGANWGPFQTRGATHQAVESTHYQPPSAYTPYLIPSSRMSTDVSYNPSTPYDGGESASAAHRRSGEHLDIINGGTGSSHSMSEGPQSLEHRQGSTTFVSHPITSASVPNANLSTANPPNSNYESRPAWAHQIRGSPHYSPQPSVTSKTSYPTSTNAMSQSIEKQRSGPQFANYSPDQQHASYYSQSFYRTGNSQDTSRPLKTPSQLQGQRQDNGSFNMTSSQSETAGMHTSFSQNEAYRTPYRQSPIANNSWNSQFAHREQVSGNGNPVDTYSAPLPHNRNTSGQLTMSPRYAISSPVPTVVRQSDDSQGQGDQRAADMLPRSANTMQSNDQQNSQAASAGQAELVPTNGSIAQKSQTWEWGHIQQAQPPTNSGNGNDLGYSETPAYVRSGPMSTTVKPSEIFSGQVEYQHDASQSPAPQQVAGLGKSGNPAQKRKRTPKPDVGVKQNTSVPDRPKESSARRSTQETPSEAGQLSSAASIAPEKGPAKSEVDIEADIRGMMNAMKAHQSRDPALFRQAWTKVVQDAPQLSAFSRTKLLTDHSADPNQGQAEVERVSVTAQQRPASNNDQERERPAAQSSTRESDSSSLQVTNSVNRQSVHTSPTLVQKIATTSSAPRASHHPSPRQAPAQAQPGPHQSTHNQPAANTPKSASKSAPVESKGAIWPASRKAALADTAARTLCAAPENAGKSITGREIHDILDQNPSYIDLCSILEGKGLVLNRAQFARTLLSAVPSSHKTYGTASQQHATREGQTVDRQGNATVAQDRMAQRVIQEDEVHLNIRAANKRRYSQVVDLTSERDELNPTDASKRPRPSDGLANGAPPAQFPKPTSFRNFVNGYRNGQQGGTVDLNRTTAGNSSTLIRALKDRTDLVKKFDKSQLTRKPAFDPRTVVSDLLIATGRHPDESSLNHHLKVLKDKFPTITNAADLATIKWDLLDPPAVGSSTETKTRRRKRRVSENLDAHGETRKDAGTSLVKDVDVNIGTNGKSKYAITLKENRFKTLLLATETAAQSSPATRRRGNPPKDHTEERPKSSIVGLRSPKSSRSKPQTSLWTPAVAPKMSIQVEVPRSENSRATPIAPAGSEAQTTPTRKYATPATSSRQSNFAVVIESRSPSVVGHTPRTAIKPSRPIRRPPGRPRLRPRADSQSTGPEIEPTRAGTGFKIYRCNWEGCGAELHNVESLRKHLGHTHLARLSHRAWLCLWAECGKITGARPRQDGINGKGSSPSGPRGFDSKEELERHVNEAHLDDYKWSYGDGPSAEYEGGRSDKSIYPGSGAFRHPVVLPASVSGPMADQKCVPGGHKPNRAWNRARGRKTPLELAESIFESVKERKQPKDGEGGIGALVDQSGAQLVTPKLRSILVTSGPMFERKSLLPKD